MKQRLTTYRLDEKVFITMFFCVIISLFLVAYRYKVNSPAPEPRIICDSSMVLWGKPMTFRLENYNAKNYKWNFGDHTEILNCDYVVNHNYEKAGVYVVSLFDNMLLIDKKEVTVKSNAVGYSIKPQFDCPVTAQVGEIITFADKTPGAENWEWYFDQGDSVDSRSKTIEWSFDAPGKKSVWLKINNNDLLVLQKTILIKDHVTPIKIPPPPRPDQHTGKVDIYPLPEPEPVKPRVDTTQNIKPQPPPAQPEVAMNAEQVKVFLFRLADDDVTAADFVKNFARNTNPQVTYNDVEMPFSKMCGIVASLKKRRIRHINVSIQCENNFVTSMKINLVKKPF